MNRVICILGMHRSGTSCLAGSLEEAGLFLGDVVTKARHNLKGNRENRRIMGLQAAILEHSGGTWASVPAQISWTDKHRIERDRIIASFARKPVWGFKDPRTVLMLPLWLEALPEMELVGTIRHPLLVAASLQTRNGGDPKRWLALWQAYNTPLLDLCRRRTFPLLRFDEDEGAYRRDLSALVQRLGLPSKRPPAFFESGLRHHVATPAGTLEPEVAKLYADLHERAVASMQ